jgi:hypothetical protein
MHFGFVRELITVSFGFGFGGRLGADGFELLWFCIGFGFVRSLRLERFLGSNL